MDATLWASAIIAAVIAIPAPPGPHLGQPAPEREEASHPNPRLSGRGFEQDASGGGGGNRTRVLQYLTRASPSASCNAFLGPGSPAGKLPTGSVAVRCPDQSRDRAGRWILLADARHRVGGIPGLTNLYSAVI